MKKFKENNLHKILRRPAFTMIELVMVIMVLGILAALAMPRLDRDLEQEAADNILSDIRYTQHMALRDYRHDNNDSNWQKSFWRIGFENCSDSTGLYEYIGSDDNYGGGINDIEAAIDPVNGKKMIWSGVNCSDGGDSSTSDRLFITHKYGIDTFARTGGCSAAQYIGFDHLGRPHQGFAGSTTPNYASYMTSACTFTFTMSDGNTFSITIEPETGHAYIVGQEDS
ncbi:MAG: type II secretion system protein [Campylobacterota bacterium]|nr:type II secretion system protein [Campylobacterota bacterium]